MADSDDFEGCSPPTLPLEPSRPAWRGRVPNSQRVSTAVVDAGDRLPMGWAAGMLEAKKQFRRVNGFLHLPALRDALDRHVTRTATPPCNDQDVAARTSPGRHLTSTELETSSLLLTSMRARLSARGAAICSQCSHGYLSGRQRVHR